MPRDTHADLVLVRDGREVARWPLPKAGPPDLGLVEGIARFHLEARRLGCAATLRHVSPELAVLLDLVGLAILAGEASTTSPGTEEASSTSP